MPTRKIFPTDGIPWTIVADDKPRKKPKLHLPTMDLISKCNAGIVRMDLKAIQHHLSRKPFNKNNTIKAIQPATSSWQKPYQSLYPNDSWTSDSMLNYLVHLLEGTANPDI
jgi:hypothetical protein